MAQPHVTGPLGRPKRKAKEPPSHAQLPPGRAVTGGLEGLVENRVILASELRKLGRLRTCVQYAPGRFAYWRFADDHRYTMRSVLWCETVFDVGDSGPWPWTVMKTHAIWKVLEDSGLDYISGGSGGKGTHTHVFFTESARPSRRRRKAFARWVCEEVADRLLGEPWLAETIADWRLWSPGTDTQTVREFGSWGNERRFRKTLVRNTANGAIGQFPAERTQVYDREQDGSLVPTIIPLNRNLPTKPPWK